MNDLRLAVIGYGMRASLSKLAHKPGEGSRVTVIVEPTDRGQGDAREFYGDDVTYLRSTDELVGRDDIDAAMIFTPDNVHFENAMFTLEQGWHTFCEKPMGITIDQCDQMLALAREKRTRLYIGHNMRHMPVVTQMKRLIDDGAIGNVKAIWTRHFVGTGGDFYFKDWHADRANVTSLLLQKGAHDIDVMHYLAGGYTRAVSGVGDLMIYGNITSRRDNTDKRMWDWYDADVFPPTTQTDLNPVVDVEDISMLHMRLDNGVLASYEQCHFTPDYWRNYTIIGDAGRLENMGDNGGEQIHVWNSRRSGAMRPDLVEVISRGEGTHAGADPNLVAEFLRFATAGGATEVSAVAAREAVATGCTGAESIRTGGSMLPVPALADDVRAYFDGGQS